jgi:hypothetical protein
MADTIEGVVGWGLGFRVWLSTGVYVLQGAYGESKGCMSLCFRNVMSLA